MYTVRNMLGDVIASGDTPQSAFIAAEAAAFPSKPRMFPRYVEPDYVRRPYEELFSVTADGLPTLWVATYELEKQFVYILSGIVALVDEGMSTIDEAQASLEVLKEDAIKWSSFSREKTNKLILDHFHSKKTKIVLVNDGIVIRHI